MRNGSNAKRRIRQTSRRSGSSKPSCVRSTTRSTNLIEAIDIVETAEGEYSVTLVEYYRGLGRTYIKAGQYQQAIVSLEQAQHISQRNLGLFNVEQAPLLDDITTAYLGLGNTTEAQKMQVERLDNAVRRFGAGDPRVIPYRYTLGEYYERSRLPDSAREQYEEVLKSQESRLGDGDAELLAPLRELVALDLLVAQGADPAQRDRLAALLEQNQNADSVERGLSFALLGDWATVTGDAADGARLLPASVGCAASQSRARRRGLLQQADDGRLRPAPEPRRPQRAFSSVHLGRDRARVRRFRRGPAVRCPRRHARPAD